MTERIDIVSPLLDVADAAELMDALRKRWRARHGNMAYFAGNRFQTRIEACVKRKLSSVPGFIALRPEQREPLRRLAREGARILGPQTAHEVDELVAALHAEAPWIAAVSAAIQQQLLAALSNGRKGLRLPPILLVGSPGCGKSHYARRLAEFAGVPLRRIDVGSGSSGFRVGGVERGWGSATPSVPVETLLATRVANPLMLVDEIDKSGVVYSDRGMSTSIATSLLEVLDPGTAAHYECPVHRVRIDVSNISWILTANDLRGVPAPLQDRCRVIHVPEPGLPDLLRLYDRMTADIDDVDTVADGRAHLAVFSAQGLSIRNLLAWVAVVRGYAHRPRHH